MILDKLQSAVSTLSETARKKAEKIALYPQVLAARHSIIQLIQRGHFDKGNKLRQDLDAYRRAFCEKVRRGLMDDFLQRGLKGEMVKKGRKISEESE